MPSSGFVFTVVFRFKGRLPEKKSASAQLWLGIISGRPFVRLWWESQMRDSGKSQSRAKADFAEKLGTCGFIEGDI